MRKELGEVTGQSLLERRVVGGGAARVRAREDFAEVGRGGGSTQRLTWPVLSTANAWR